MSLFYNHRFLHRFPVPLLAFERLSNLDTSDPVIAIIQVLQEVCGIQKPDDEDISYFLSRHREQIESKDSARSPNEERQHLTRGTFFQKFLAKQDSATLLLMACGWDYKKAEYWYTQVDVSAAEKLMNTYVERQVEDNGHLYEAVLYGFGGRYKDSVVDEEIDGTDMSVDELMALQFH